MFRFMRRAGGWATAWLLCGTAVFAAPPPGFPNAYAIVGAKVEMGDGRTLPKADILIRNGIIQKIGPNLDLPPDAEVTSGEGRTVYPGFIDAHATAGLKLPESRPAQDEPPDEGSDAPPFMREAHRKGIRPDLDAADWIDPADGKLMEARKSGFTAALVVPPDGMIQGTGALIHLSGRPRRDSILLPQAAMGMSFNNGPEPGYPFSLMGIIAQMRQTMLDARRYEAVKVAYDRGGTVRPPADDALESMQDALKGRLPVLFTANSENEIRRALRLADEFGLDLILSGGGEAWKVAPELARRGIPVILTLDYGPEPKQIGERDKKAEEKDKESKKPVEEGPKKDEPKEPAEAPIPEAVMKDLQRKWTEKTENARRLNEAGVRMAFSLRGSKNAGEFWKNLRTAIKAGLPGEAALRALTDNPARIYEATRELGGLAEGRPARFVVMSEAFDSEKAKPLYVFIEDRMIRLEEEKPTPSPPAPKEADEDHGPH